MRESPSISKCLGKDLRSAQWSVIMKDDDKFYLDLKLKLTAVLVDKY
jgi:hypothetical protein